MLFDPLESTRSDLLTAAREDHGGVVELVRRLVQAPSRGGVDPYDGVLGVAYSWLRKRELPVTVLRDDTDAVVGLCCAIDGDRPGPRWVLDACLDTAPFGDESVWTHPPTSAHVADGWMWGRGTADSKSGAAIFCHVAARVARIAHQLSGSMTILLDTDEHTGRFGGAKRYFEGPGAPNDVAGVMIGYPGLDKLIVGGRGVFRVRFRIHGVSSHSGGSESSPNAITKAAHLVDVLTKAPIPDDTTHDFPFAPKLTVTEIRGGEGFSATPDLCTMAVDIRTTPVADSRHFRQLLQEAVTVVDQAWPGTRATDTELGTEWPPYHTGGSGIRRALLDAAGALGLDVRPKVSGMSNIGNYLAGLGIPATAGFGVTYEGLHATDERIRLDTIPTVQAVYHSAVLELLASTGR